MKSKQNEALAAQVVEIYWFHKRRYGSRRICAELKATGIKAGRHRVRSLMRQQDLRAIQPRSFVPRTTISDNRRASPNLLIGAKPTGPKAVLVGDITYLPLFGGKWCYLASWQDKVSKRVVGWKVAMRMTDDLVIEALEKALVRGLVAHDAIIHSDRGSQYSSNDFRKLLKQHGLRQSMSGKTVTITPRRRASGHVSRPNSSMAACSETSLRQYPKPSATSMAITTASVATRPSVT